MLWPVPMDLPRFQNHCCLDLQFLDLGFPTGTADHPVPGALSAATDRPAGRQGGAEEEGDRGEGEGNLLCHCSRGGGESTEEGEQEEKEDADSPTRVHIQRHQPQGLPEVLLLSEDFYQPVFLDLSSCQEARPGGKQTG